MLEFAVANKDEIDATNVKALLHEFVEILTLAASEVQYIAKDPAGPIVPRQLVDALINVIQVG